MAPNRGLKRKVEFLSKGQDTTGDGEINWIGFKAKSITGEEKEFWWWRNYTDPINKLKVFCGSLLAQRLIEAQIGPGVNFWKSSQETKKVSFVQKIKGEQIYGIYIESKHRPMFNFNLAISGLKLPKNTSDGF